MKLNFKATFCFLLCICSALVTKGQSIDSLLVLTQSKDNYFKAKGHLELFILFAEQDSLRSQKHLKLFNEIDLAALTDSNFREIVKRKSVYLRSTFRFREAVNFLKKTMLTSQKNNDSESQALFHQLITPNYFYLFLYDSCNYHLDKAIEFYTEVGDIDKLGVLKLRKSGIQYTLGNYEQAIEYAFKATELFKKANNEDQLSVAFLQLGNIFYFLEDYNEAKKYYQLSAKAFKQTGNLTDYYQAYSNIGLILVKQGKFRESIPIQLEAVKEFKKNKQELELGNAYWFLSSAYLNLDLLDSAEYYNELSIQSSQKTDYTIGLGQCLLTKARIAYQKGNFQEAKKYGLLAYKTAGSIKHYESLKLITEWLAEIFEQLGDINSSYKYLKENIILKDSLDIDPNFLKNYAILHQFKIEEAQFNLMLSGEREKMQSELNKKQQRQLFIAILIAIASVISLFFTIIMLIRNKKLTKEIEVKKTHIKEELVVKESLLSEIHHRVKNNLQVISSMLSLQTQYIEDEDLQKIISDCQGRINSMSLIHESLYKKIDSKEALFSTYIRNLIPKLIDTYHIDESKVKLIMDLEPIQLSLDESIPSGLIINEIVSNSLKHAFPEGKNGTISIGLKRNGQIIELQIADNGVGLKDHLNFEKPESFGFLLIETLANQLEAEVTVNSTDKMEYLFRWSSPQKP